MSRRPIELVAVIFLAILISFAGPVFAQDDANSDVTRFRGEELYYSLEFVGASLARGALVMGDIEQSESGQVVSIFGLAMTEGLAAMLFPLRDEGTTQISAATGLPITTSKILDERGQYRRYDVEFSLDLFSANVTRLRHGITEFYSRVLPSTTHDALSWVYAVRQQDLTPGTASVYYIYDGWKLSRATATVLDETESILVGDEFIECARLRLTREVLDSAAPIPFIQSTPFPPALWVREDTLDEEQVGEVWIGLDDRRLPIQMTFQNSLISATAVLEAFQPPSAGY